jgi:hypothetical protein
MGLDASERIIDLILAVTSGAKLSEMLRFEFAEVRCPGECRFRWRFS